MGMVKIQPRFSRTIFTWGAVIFAAIIVVNVNFLVERLFPLTHLDLTEEQLYTISEGTRQTLAGIDEPINVEVYFSEALGERAPSYAQHFERLKTMFDQYSELANGRLIVNYSDPLPFSTVEESAVASGLIGLPTNTQGDLSYFGIVASNSIDEESTIPFVDIGREQFLEYDLTSRIYQLANPEKSVVGLITGLGIDGSSSEPEATPGPDWLILDQLRQFFDLDTLINLTELSPRLEEVPANIDILLVTQPLTLTETTVYAIDQFVLGGGKIVLFADPSATVAAGIAYDAKLVPLLRAWGIEIDRKTIVGDRKNAQRLRMLIDNRPAITDLVIWPTFGVDNISHDDVAVAGIEKLAMATAGVISVVAGAESRVRPLVESSSDSMIINVEDVRHSPNPTQLLRDFEPSGEPYAVAVRISGVASTAFPDGPPDQPPANDEAAPGSNSGNSEEATEQAHIASGEVNAIVVADIDMLNDRFWVAPADPNGQQTITMTSDNARFLTNALENLSGQPLLIGLRGRGVDDRPFELVQSIRLAAEREFRDQERALAEELEKVEVRLAQLQSADALFLSSEDQQLVIDFRNRASEIRREMRDVRLALRLDIDRLSLWTRVVNIGGVPAALTLAAVGVVGWRRSRRRNRR